MKRQKRTDRVIVITGASAGVGRATVQAFAREGARIGLIARGRAGLEGAKRDAEKLGGEALILPVDVADAPAVENAAAQVEEQFGPIDVRVNDAMTSVFSPIKEMTPEEFKRVTETPISDLVSGLWLRLSECCRAIAASSSKSGQHWLIAAFRCRQPITQPNTPSRDFAIRFVAS